MTRAALPSVSPLRRLSAVTVLAALYALATAVLASKTIPRKRRIALSGSQSAFD